MEGDIDSPHPQETDVNTEQNGGHHLDNVDVSITQDVVLSTKPRPTLPLHHTNLLSYLLYTWLEPLMWKAFRRGLTMDDVWLCAKEDGAQENAKILQELWGAELQTHKSGKLSLRRVFLTFVKRRLLVALCVLILAMIGLLVCSCYLLMLVLRYSRHHSADDIYYGVIVVVLLFLTDIVQNVLFVTVFTITHVAGIRLRSGSLFLLYKKLLSLNCFHDKTIGYIVNLFASDSQRIFEGVSFAPMIIIAPVLILATTGYSIYLLGPWALVGFTILLLLFPLQMSAGKLIMSLRNRTALVTDKRVRIMNEVLSHIKFIKMYVWEHPFIKRITDVRSSECDLVEKNTLSIIIAMLLSLIIVSIATSATIILCSISGYEVSPVTAFTYIIVYSSIQGKLMLSTMSVKCFSELFVAADRFQAILEMEDRSIQDETVDKSPKSEFSVELSNVHAKWLTVTEPEENIKKKKTKDNERSENHHIVNEQTILTATEFSNAESTLKEVTLKIEQGDIVAVTGGVGSGKSALLNCILGQMLISEGQRVIRGKMAYVPQNPWTFHASVKENIVFGYPYNEKRYHWVLDICCIKDDIAKLQDTDNTIIGERGLTLSGGQKQRLSLARALYSDRDVFVLDDPLSAVDPDIAEQLFTNLITGALLGKTVILATSRHQFVSAADYIVYMSDGCIVGKGSFDELIEENGSYAAYYNNVILHDPYSKSAVAADAIRLSSYSGMRFSLNNTNETNTNQAPVALDQEEECLGAVKASTYWSYTRAAGGVGVLIVVIVLFFLAEGCRAFGFYWLSHWLSKGSDMTPIYDPDTNQTTISNSISENPHLYFYNGIYAAILVAMILLFVIRSICAVKVMVKASSSLHLRLLQRIIRAPMVFFESTPRGRIVNRFSKDMDELDTQLPVMLDQVIETLIGITLYTVLIGLILRWFLFAVPPLFILFLLAYCVFRVGAREIKRMQNASMSPLLSHVTSSMEGIASIRAYEKDFQYINIFQTILDNNTVLMLVYNFCMRWINVRLSLITSLAVGFVALLLIALPDHVTPPMAGLAIVFAAQLSTLFQHFVRSAVETEAKFTSAERILTYVKSVSQEKELVGSMSTTPPATWPRNGNISFNKVTFQYQPHMPFVLKSISCDISSGSRVAVVGHTGAGKSSLAVCIYRLVELRDGTITIDGVDCATLKLQHLRSNMSIIPQEPVLFAGTIRSNLDPWTKHIDLELWRALEACNVKETVLTLDRKLDAVVLENGDNFSAGERQLLCLARVLLRRSKVLILDEATASVDSQTDGAIQATLAEVFTDCTILVIAHRLSTIMTCDKVIVLADGGIIEYDSPTDLLHDKKSYFSELMAVDQMTENSVKFRESTHNKAWV